MKGARLRGVAPPPFSESILIFNLKFLKMATKIYSSNGPRIRRRLSVYDKIVKKLVLLGDSRTEAQNKARDMFKLINIQSQVKFNDYAIS